MQERTYRLPAGFNLTTLGNDIRHFFLMRDHRVQVVPVGETLVIQAVRDSTLTTLLGQSSALTVQLQVSGNHLLVEIGTSKWLEKAALGVVSYVLLGPLVVLPIVGAFNQLKLVEDLWTHIDTRLTQPSEAYVPPVPPEPSYRGYQSIKQAPPPPAEQHCPACRAPMPVNAIFCSRCGARSPVVPHTTEAASIMPSCPQCGLVNQAGARFCSGCGYRFP
ncbi:MAG: zinc-ribbon domain-containing protein [Acidobacteriota bacterium]